MAKRPTIDDLAAAAGVSVATVDRVLNGRHKVREATAKRVAEAAGVIGFYATGLLRHRVSQAQPKRTLGFLLQKQDTFYEGFAQELIAATKRSVDLQGQAIVEFVNEVVPLVIAARIRELGLKVDALTIVAVDHPHVNQAVADVRQLGKPVFTLLADLSAPERSGHIGIDNRKAGRTAAWAIARTAREPGIVGVLVGSHRYLNQENAEISFRSYFREHAPEFRLLESLVNLDESRIAYEATAELLHRNPSLVGLYNSGGGMAGMIEAIRDEGAASRIFVVCNELIPVTRTALIEGVVDLAVGTPIRLLSDRAVQSMAAALSSQPPEGLQQFLFPAELYISENV